jgi:hypothetical protein
VDHAALGAPRAKPVHVDALPHCNRAVLVPA